MANNKVDIAFDNFMQIYELYQMNSEEINEFQDMVEKRLNSFYLGAIETEKDRKLEHSDDMAEEKVEIEYDNE